MTYAIGYAVLVIGKHPSLSNLIQPHDWMRRCDEWYYNNRQVFVDESAARAVVNDLKSSGIKSMLVRIDDTPRNEKWFKLVNAIPKVRCFGCSDKLHHNERNYCGLDELNINYNIHKGATKRSTEMARLFMAEHPEYIVIIHGIDSWGVYTFLSKMPPPKKPGNNHD